MITIQDILQNLLLQNDENWEIESVSSDDVAEEIHVKLRYRFPEVKADGKFYQSSTTAMSGIGVIWIFGSTRHFLKPEYRGTAMMRVTW